MTDARLWAVVQIGCLHCNAESRILHVISDETGARTLARHYQIDFSLEDKRANSAAVDVVPKRYDFVAMPLPGMK